MDNVVSCFYFRRNVTFGRSGGNPIWHFEKDPGDFLKPLGRRMNLPCLIFHFIWEAGWCHGLPTAVNAAVVAIVIRMAQKHQMQNFPKIVEAGSTIGKLSTARRSTRRYLVKWKKWKILVLDGIKRRGTQYITKANRIDHMKILKLSLLVWWMLLLASHSSFAQNHIRIHSREQLATLNEQMCFYLEGHRPELSHERLSYFFKPGIHAGIEQPFASKGQYTVHVQVTFCNSVDEAKNRFLSLRTSSGRQGVFVRNLGDETWILGGEGFLRKGTMVIFVTLIETENSSSSTHDQTKQQDTGQLQSLPELEEVEVYNHQLKKFETIQTIKSSRRDYTREIVELILEFFEKYGN